MGQSPLGPQARQGGPHPLPTGDLGKGRLVALGPQRVDRLLCVIVLVTRVGSRKVQDCLLGGRGKSLPEISRHEHGIQTPNVAADEVNPPRSVHELKWTTLSWHRDEGHPIALGSALCTRAAVSPVRTGTRSP